MTAGMGHVTRASVVITLFGVSTAGAASAQMTDATDEAVRLYASSWFHGLEGIPDSLRLLLAPDRRFTDRLEDILVGRREAPPGFDNGVAIWWLADSGRPEYVPTFLRFSRDANGDVATVSIYGLTNHLDNESVRTRLLEIDASGANDVRHNMAILLTLVNDTHARILLASMRRQHLSNETIQRIERALAAPAASGPVRYPCLENERRARKPRCAQ